MHEEDVDSDYNGRQQGFRRLKVENTFSLLQRHDYFLQHGEYTCIQAAKQIQGDLYYSKQKLNGMQVFGMK